MGTRCRFGMNDGFERGHWVTIFPLALSGHFNFNTAIYFSIEPTLCHGHGFHAKELSSRNNYINTVIKWV